MHKPVAICYCEERRRRSNLDQEDCFASLAMTGLHQLNATTIKEFSTVYNHVSSWIYSGAFWASRGRFFLSRKSLQNLIEAGILLPAQIFSISKGVVAKWNLNYTKMGKKLGKTSQKLFCYLAIDVFQWARVQMVSWFNWFWTTKHTKVTKEKNETVANWQTNWFLCHCEERSDEAISW